ncbi:MAG: hypothetical protein J6A01_09600, partial [Proteobacteria bacterium]|nr:hypothetical protein [Pseudomonadota bacterium]
MAGMFKTVGYCAVLCTLVLASAGCDERGHQSPLDNAWNEDNPGQDGGQNGGQNGGQDGGQNGGQNTQGCGDIPDSGRCNGDVVQYCENGELKSYDCSQENKTCATQSDDTHSWDGCVDKQGGNPSGGGCGDIPDTGVCDGAVVKYCKDGNPESYDCSQEGKICGETSAETHSFGCMDNPGGSACGDVPETGRCNGNIVEYCKDGNPESYDCAKESKICGVTSAETNSYGCIASTVDPPAPGDLKTAEDWARARIAGSVSSDDAFNAIAYNGGFPVITDDNTVIFMHWYEGGDWKVVGDFNDWNTSSTAMTNNGDIWYAEVPMPADLNNKNYYKYYNANEADESKKYQADPWALNYGYTEDGEISYIVKPNKPHLERYHNFKSPQGLKSRTLRIYMPAGDGP